MVATKTSTPYAVLMGDIVGSEQADALETLYQEFNSVIDQANEIYNDIIASPLTITLGDEFQGLFLNLRGAATVAREIRLRLMSRQIDCRFVLGMVDLKSPLNSTRAWNMMGVGLAQARERLNEKIPQNLYRFALPGRPTLETLLEALGAGLTSLERRWTFAQLHDISETLSGRSVAEIASRRNVSVHSVYKVRSNGEMELYLIYWNAMLKALEAIDIESETPA